MLNTDERLLVEAINNLFSSDAKLGLAAHLKQIDAMGEHERGYEHLHGQIDEMFALKTANSVHADALGQAFFKVHSYKYLDDPSFRIAMEKEMLSTGVPAEERKKALDHIDKIISELKAEKKDWAERDAGFSPQLDEIKEVSQPEQPLSFEIHDRDGFNDKNVEWERGDASMGRIGDST